MPEKRTEQIHVRVTPSEKRALQAMAEQQHLDVSSFLRLAAFQTQQ